MSASATRVSWKGLQSLAKPRPPPQARARARAAAAAAAMSPASPATPSVTPSTASPILEGVFAISKPAGITSAQVIRDVQTHFNPSALFAPWMQREKERQQQNQRGSQKKRKSWKQRQPLQVKIGHGGTLDPMATGILILGVGSGTKSLPSFLECTKSYETVALFGAATDSYDTEGKIVARKPYSHVTRELVESGLEKFKGKIMQRPPIFSAKRIQGKRLYEYAREGLPLPDGYKIEECAVEVKELGLTGWYEGGSHSYQWPMEEAQGQEKNIIDGVLDLKDEGNETTAQQDAPGSMKRKHEEVEATVGGAITDQEQSNVETDASLSSSPSKRRKASPQPTADGAADEVLASGALPADNTTATTFNTVEAAVSSNPASQDANTLVSLPEEPALNANTTDSASTNVTQSSPSPPPCPAPAARISMTTTSGFYVRSLCHDLAAALGSVACMASLIRTRQADFELGSQVLSYEDLAKGEDVWAPKVKGMLEAWGRKERELAEGNQKEEGDTEG